MNKAYISDEIVSGKFLRVPTALFENPRYRKLSAESKLLYSLLLDRMSLSQKNGWVNGRGEVYQIYTRENIAHILSVSYKKAIAVFKELIESGLLYEERQGRGLPNKLYVLKCEPEKDISTLKTAEQNITESNFKKSKSDTSECVKTAVDDVKKSQPIQTYNNYTDKSYTEYNQSTDPELTEILHKCRLNCFEEKTARMFENALRILFYKEKIRLSGALLPQAEIRNLLRQVDCDTLIDALETLRENENSVQNPQGYLYSVILNAVSADHTSTILELPREEMAAEELYLPE